MGPGFSGSCHQPHLTLPCLAESASRDRRGNPVLRPSSVFADSRLSDLFAYEPQILAAPPGTLVRLADYVFHGAWNAASVDTALFALTVLGQTPIAEEQRLLAWRAFRVPLYELLIDLDAGVLAAECEAHEGWHIQHPQLRFDLQAGKIVFQKNGISVVPVCTGLTADGLDGICGCGAAAPLLRNVRLLQRVEQRSVRQMVRAGKTW